MASELDDYETPARRITAADMVWQAQAVCAQTDPELFYPQRGQPTGPARAICAVCPVRLDCLTAGLHEDYGVWGGLSEDERKLLRDRIANATISQRDAALRRATNL